MVGDGDFLKSQRPESGKEREYGMPAQRQRIMHEDLSPVKPSSYGPHRPAQTGKRRDRRIQTPEPSAQRGRVGHAIGILNGRCRGFPGSAFGEAAVQRLAAGDEAVMAVGRREGRQKCERLMARLATPAPNRNPIVVLIMRLFAAAAMPDDGVLGTNRTTAQDDFSTGLGPIFFEVVLRGGK